MARITTGLHIFAYARLSCDAGIARQTVWSPEISAFIVI